MDEGNGTSGGLHGDPRRGAASVVIIVNAVFLQSGASGAVLRRPVPRQADIRPKAVPQGTLKPADWRRGTPQRFRRIRRQAAAIQPFQ